MKKLTFLFLFILVGCSESEIPSHLLLDNGGVFYEVGKKTPFNGTIAHGFLTVSLLSAMYYDAIPVMEGSKLGVNYGFDKLRFLSPVKVGSKVRGRFELSDIREVKPFEISTTWRVEVEIEDFEKPALVAHWIGRQYLSKGNSPDG